MRYFDLIIKTLKIPFFVCFTIFALIKHKNKRKSRIQEYLQKSSEYGKIISELTTSQNWVNMK